MTFQEILDKKNALEEQLEEVKQEFVPIAKKEFERWAKELFPKYSWLESISWSAYTPSFNDGSPCLFSSNHDDFDINNGDNDPEEVTEEESEKAAEEISEFLCSFSDDDMEILFGDGVRVTITEDGVTTDDYYD